MHQEGLETLDDDGYPVISETQLRQLIGSSERSDREHSPDINVTGHEEGWTAEEEVLFKQFLEQNPALKGNSERGRNKRNKIWNDMKQLFGYKYSGWKSQLYCNL
jgi:GrpB-like predicted nucleotidyltransferase (UPF0157 family)